MNEKEVRYIHRTVEHIHRVQKNMVLLVTKYSKKLGLDKQTRRRLLSNVMLHDRSKFSSLQYGPYIELTEFYRQRKTLKNESYEYPTEDIRQKVDEAIKDHYMKENHHPEILLLEFHESWDDLKSIEAACDLQAMAQEFEEGSFRKYYESVWKARQSRCFIKKNWPKVTRMMEMCLDCFEIESGDALER